MSLRSILAVVLLACALYASQSFAQSSSPVQPFPHTKIVLAESSFIDLGPPFDFYSLYHLTSTSSGTDVEKIGITPPGDACLQPATTEVSHAHLQQSLAELFNHKDPCTIPEKELRREAKRCKHCLVFSVVHVVAQVQCNGKPRDTQYEVLDRDIFDSRTQTPMGTSRTMELMNALNKEFGGGVWDRPVFPVSDTESSPKLPSGDDALLADVAAAKYDSIFQESISQLYRDSQQPTRKPSVSLKSSSPSAPISSVMPAYPPIARVAHVEGEISLQLETDPDGTVRQSERLTGPKIFEAASIDAVKKWSYPTQATGSMQSVTLQFNLNCARSKGTTSAK